MNYYPSKSSGLDTVCAKDQLHEYCWRGHSWYREKYSFCISIQLQRVCYVNVYILYLAKACCMDKPMIIVGQWELAIQPPTQTFLGLLRAFLRGRLLAIQKFDSPLTLCTDNLFSTDTSIRQTPR